MRTAFLVVSSLAAVAPAWGEEKKETAEEVVKQLKGTWQCVSVEYVLGDRKRSDRELAKRTTFSFTDDTLTVRSVRTVVHKFTVDPAAEPKRLDLVTAEGDRKGTLVECVYKFEDDLLVVCYGSVGKGNRPKDFDVTKHMGAQVFVFERKKE